jgi:hypothetical protein
MLSLLLGALMGVSFAGHVPSYQKNCFGDHIRESIEINSQRRSVYRDLTEGQSDRIFNFLIATERLSLLPASYYDLRSRPYQRNGVPLFCHEFVSMNAAPDFDPERRVIPPETFTAFDWRFHRDRISYAVSVRDAELVKAVSLQAIQALAAWPNYYCMLRHIIESVYRFAYFLPLQQEAARDAGLKSPAALSFEVMWLQVQTLGSAYRIDLWSAPIQRQGIPILCAELPRLLDDLDVELAR